VVWCKSDNRSSCKLNFLWRTACEKMCHVCCPICVIKPQQHFGSELTFIFNRFTSTKSTKGDYIHQVIHHQIIPSTIHHFRIEQFESTIDQINQTLIAIYSIGNDIKKIFDSAKVIIPTVETSSKTSMLHPIRIHLKTVLCSEILMWWMRGFNHWEELQEVVNCIRNWSSRLLKICETKKKTAILAT